MKSTWITMNRDQQIRLVQYAHATASLDNGHLGNVRHSHTLERCQQRVIRRHRDHRAFFVTSRDKLAECARGWTFEVSLIQHPVVVVHLREIFRSRVANKCDYA